MLTNWQMKLTFLMIDQSPGGKNFGMDLIKIWNHLAFVDTSRECQCVEKCELCKHIYILIFHSLPFTTTENWRFLQSKQCKANLNIWELVQHQNLPKLDGFGETKPKFAKISNKSPNNQINWQEKGKVRKVNMYPNLCMSFVRDAGRETCNTFLKLHQQLFLDSLFTDLTWLLTPYCCWAPSWHK